MRDASGNVMMVYKAIESSNEYFVYREIEQSEASRVLGSSSRLGIKKYHRMVAVVQIPNEETPEEEQLGQLVEDLRISELNYDSPLTPNKAIVETHIGEYIALYNISVEPMDLSDIEIVNTNLNTTHAIADGTMLQSGQTYYELSNHLGNVLVTVTDMKVGISTDGDWVAEYYEATVVSANDYYPFGSAMVGRKFSSGAYRYGFNGMEKDDEMKGLCRPEKRLHLNRQLLNLRERLPFKTKNIE